MADRATLKGYFNNGDIPTEGNFAELIDSVKMVAESDPLLCPIHIGRTMAVDNTWQNVAQFLVPKPSFDWTLTVVGLIGCDQELGLRIVNAKGEEIFTLDYGATPVAITQPFQVVDLSHLQGYGDYVHLILQACIIGSASAGNIEAHHLSFTAAQP
jgi:hypothetical protein